jgi:hypothetical protein
VTEGSTGMPVSHEFDPSPIDRPRCPRCQSRMTLALIAPGPRGYDLHAFECAACDHTCTLTTLADPMRSDLLGWLAHERKQPK